jgi:glycosyltransferase involved in cell wall biosynthesis
LQRQYEFDLMDLPTAEHRRPRVLMIVYACAPNQGSEEGIGWHRATQVARHCDVWAICEQRAYAPAIRRYIDDYGPPPGLEFHFVARRAWEDTLWRIPGAGYLSYNLWHRRALRLARRLHRQIGFDLVHQVTYSGYREPGYLWKLGIPFVWGPVGGTQNYPWRFLAQAGLRGALHETARNVVNHLQLRLAPRPRRAARRAAALFTSNTTNLRDFARCFRVDSDRLSDTGIQRVTALDEETRRASGRLRIVWSGRLEHRKALHLLLEALHRMPPSVNFELCVLGRGPLEQRWKRLAERLGLNARCRWLGWLPHDQALAEFRRADVFAFTSLRDSMGTVVLEALGAGLPVLCLDHQGAGDAVTSQCGIKVPVRTPRQVISDLRDALVEVAGDVARREAMGRAARRRAEHYLWSRQAEQIVAAYREVLDEKVALPEATSASHRATAVAPSQL